jgi:hypothetical protein
LGDHFVLEKGIIPAFGIENTLNSNKTTIRLNGFYSKGTLDSNGYRKPTTELHAFNGLAFDANGAVSFPANPTIVNLHTKYKLFSFHAEAAYKVLRKHYWELLLGSGISYQAWVRDEIPNDNISVGGTHQWYSHLPIYATWEVHYFPNDHWSFTAKQIYGALVAANASTLDHPAGQKLYHETILQSQWHYSYHISYLFRWHYVHFGYQKSNILAVTVHNGDGTTTPSQTYIGRSTTTRQYFNVGFRYYF